MNIRVDDLSGAEVQSLLAAHLRGMHDHSPPESVHALDLKHGFEFCGPFGDYTNDPFSRFMTRRVVSR